MSNEVLTAWWQEVCAELGVPAPTHYIRATMRDLKDAKKIRKILSDPRLLIYDWLFGERPTDKPANSVGP